MESSLWTEKYRPESFSEVKGQKEIVKRIKAFVDQKNMPHLLFAGPAGTGKTTLSLVVVKQLYKDQWHENFLDLNASDERGINIVREKVKDFARTKSLGKVSFKIIFLDEADALTPEAQQALRRTMENYSSTCRFIMSCNYSSKIIDPIQSRCAIFRFKLL
ncbi:TPA: AAA family ATPase, partial [Candidatus Woesearchaeota archaeon]|nr:AAA family ATPase [Candidatus Woesearchaeota archaeon]